jgi:hypothetical protein
MTTDTLRSVALDVIDNYRRTAKFTADALRHGSIRGISRVNSAVGGMISDYEGKVSKKVKRSIDGAQKRFTRAADRADRTVDRVGNKVKTTLHGTERRIVDATHKVDGAVEKLLNGASRKLAKFPAKNTRLSKLMDNKAISSVEPLGIPGAKFLRFVSSALADSAEELATKVAGAKKPAAVKRTPARTARRKTKFARK